MVNDRILGAVLAGGASSRFGSDKAAAVLGGRTLLDHASAAIAPFVTEVVVIGRADGVPDLPVAGLGPLGGIAGALGYAARQGFASVLTIGCDMPVVPAGLIGKLLQNSLTYCKDAPILGHWPVDLLGDLMARLSSAQDVQPGSKNSALSVRQWAASINAVAIPAPSPLANINTPADLPPP